MKPPAFPFYVRDWLTGTRRLSPAVKGVYIDLLAWSWDNGPIPYRVAEVAKILGLSRAQVVDKWGTLRGRYFKKCARGYVNPRLERERAKCKAFAELQAERGRKSGAARANAGSTMVQPALNLALALAPALADHDQDQDQRASALRVRDVIRPLTKIAHVVLDDVGRGTVPARDAIDELKLRAARARIPYDASVIAKAMTSAEIQRAEPAAKGWA